MGKERSSPVWDYFVYDPNANMSSCMINGCRMTMKGGHASNLERHIQRYHPEVFKVVIEDKQKAQKRLSDLQLSLPPEKKRVSSTSNSGGSVGNFADLLSYEQLMDSCVELVTVNGRPLSLMDDSGFRKIINPVLACIDASEGISSDIVQQRIKFKANEIRGALQVQLDAKLVCLKVDLAIWRENPVMSVSIQYVQDGTIVLHTLSVLEISKSSTSEDLGSMVNDVLNQYCIPVERVYSLTTDSASNLVKVASLIQNANDESSLLTEISGESNLLDELELTDNCGYKIHGSRCMACALDLVVSDVLNEEDVQTVLRKIREICKCLQKQKSHSKFIKAGFEKPKLDHTHHWHSTLEMVSSVLTLKDIMSEEMSHDKVDIQLTDKEWTVVEQLVRALQPVKYTAKLFEYEPLVVGDFYKEWLKCEVDTAKLGNEFGKKMSRALKKRAKSFFQCDTFISSLFLDPRFNVLLSEEDCKRAKTYLEDVWGRICKVKGSSDDISVGKGGSASPDAIVAYESDDCDEIDKILQREEAQKRMTRRESRKSISRSLETFLNMPRIPKDENLFSFWEMERATSGPYSNLYELACVVLAVPVTHVSVERLASTLHSGLSPVKNSLMDPESLSDLMIVRSNMMLASRLWLYNKSCL